MPIALSKVCAYSIPHTGDLRHEISPGRANAATPSRRPSTRSISRIVAPVVTTSSTATTRAPAGALVVAVDDVVTTGATIREMERVLGRLDGVAALARPGLIS